MTLKSPSLIFFVILLLVVLVTVLAPLEKTLGANARIVYLHGAWVWVALAMFLAAGAVGLFGLAARKDGLHRWSRALGRTGLFFWVTYLPLSMWAMQTNWNGLFLAEPRWRLALIFSVGGLLLQIGVTLLDAPVWASTANLVYIVALTAALRTAESVMHPSSPILNSDARRIQIFFLGLLLLTLLAAWQVARWWYQFERSNVDRLTR